MSRLVGALVLAMLAACSGSSSSPADAAAPDAAPVAVACTYATAASCNQLRNDYSCMEFAEADGWVREEVLNLDCPTGSPAAPCGGATSQPFVVSVMRLCHAGGAGQMTPCPDGTKPLTGNAGCGVCATIKLTCL